jgi:hypothetical protein
LFSLFNVFQLDKIERQSEPDTVDAFKGNGRLTEKNISLIKSREVEEKDVP